MPVTAPEQHYDLSVADAAVVQELANAGPDQRIILLRRYLAAFGPGSLVHLCAQVIGLANSVVANNREVIELAGIINGTLHPHTAHQINLPTISGAASGVALAAQATGAKGRCAGCAYRLGTAANQSPITTDDARYVVQDDKDFLCHMRHDRYGKLKSLCRGHAHVVAKATSDA